MMASTAISSNKAKLKEKKYLFHSVSFQCVHVDMSMYIKLSVNVAI